MRIRLEGGPWDGVELEVATAPNQIVLQSPFLTSESVREDFEDELDYIETVAHHAQEKLLRPEAKSYTYSRSSDVRNGYSFVYRLGAGE
jgi:hypothetical protein